VGGSLVIFRRTWVVAGLVAGLAFPGSAGALSAPAVFYAEGDVSSYQGDLPQSLWRSLSGADAVTLSPTIGVQLQDSQSAGTSHPFKIEALSVPDGRPSQDPFYWGGGCIFASGQLGQVGSLQQLQYEGPGPYTIRVTAFNASAISAGCATGGSATTASFTISGRPTLQFTAPTLLAGGPKHDAQGRIIGLTETLPPLASGQQTVCALNARVAGDGSISGQPSLTGGSGGISQQDFPVPGNWTCVARAFAGVSNPAPGDANPLRATAWSAPVTALFQADVSGVSAPRVSDGKAPGFALAGKVNRAAAGGVLTMRVSPTRRCPPALTPEVDRARVRADGSYRFSLRLAVKSSHRGKLDIALWRGAVSFAGNRLVRPDAHFGQLYFGRSVAFVPGIGYLRPPSQRRLRLFDGGSCVDYG
jgi:hypothetical protein